MIKAINHNSETLPGALFISDSVKNDIIEVCLKYYNELSITVILEMIQTNYGFGSMVFASFILGQICSAHQVNKTNQNLLKQWQRPN